MSQEARPPTPRTAAGQGPQAVAGRREISSGLVAFIVGETSRAGSRSRLAPLGKGRRPARREGRNKRQAVFDRVEVPLVGGRPRAVVGRRRLRARPNFDPQSRRCRTRQERSARPKRGVHAGKAKDRGRQCPLVTCAFLDHYPGIRGGVGSLVNGPAQMKRSPWRARSPSDRNSLSLLQPRPIHLGPHWALWGPENTSSSPAAPLRLLPKNATLNSRSARCLRVRKRTPT